MTEQCAKLKATLLDTMWRVTKAWQNFQIFHTQFDGGLIKGYKAFQQQSEQAVDDGFKDTVDFKLSREQLYIIYLYASKCGSTEDFQSSFTDHIFRQDTADQTNVDFNTFMTQALTAGIKDAAFTLLHDAIIEGNSILFESIFGKGCIQVNDVWHGLIERTLLDMVIEADKDNAEQEKIEGRQTIARYLLNMGADPKTTLSYEIDGRPHPTAIEVYLKHQTFAKTQKDTSCMGFIYRWFTYKPTYGANMIDILKEYQNQPPMSHTKLD
ncbi:MAG: hypothetical protein ACK4PR_01485 [Gammaproteobacteria bacterium]